ncbi:hypothetical protein HPB51_023280 [Rhipicephalus microplus]|uniref:Uncharacterized protein n=1 Tax=Rhipicephalus microplus TaxID=6941 RepID=A0A9J6EV16_RHIMP|nr:hypothetical protein HPB51_023280 [Rhipicephalus microplus]
MADGLPKGFPSGLAHRNGRQTTRAASLTYLQHTYQCRETQGSHEPVVRTSAADREQRWSKAMGTNSQNFYTEKTPSNKKADSHHRHFRDARDPGGLVFCQETEIQITRGIEVGYPEKTECELSPSPQKSGAASSGSSPITEMSSPTSSSPYSHNTLASSPNTSVEGSSPEQEPGSFSLCGEHIRRGTASHTVLRYRSPPGPTSCGRASTTPTPENWMFERVACPSSPPAHRLLPPGGTGSKTVETGRPKLPSIPAA